MVREALTMKALDRLEPRRAAALFVTRRAEGFTSDEQQLLTDWLAKDGAHQQAFASADRAWASFAHADGHEILSAMRAHALAPGGRERARADARAGASWWRAGPAWWPAGSASARAGSASRPTGSGWGRAVAAAAVLLVAVGVALYSTPTLNPWSSQSPLARVAAPVHYVSARGEVQRIRLADGSDLTLDADSAITATFRKDGRAIDLQRGRAFFEVAPDKSRPFAVTAAGRTVVAVGTHFDVNLAAGTFSVTLLEGHVIVGAVGSTQAPVMLEPGQQYVERLGRATIRSLDAATENEAAWRTGLVSFSNQTLSEAVAVMNRYSREQIVIRDPAVASLNVSGQFRAGDTPRFARTLADLHRLRLTTTADEIELARPK